MCLGVAAAMLFAAPAVRAQETPSEAVPEAPTATGEPRFSGGVRAAFSVSDVSAVQEHDPRFGVGGGIFLQSRAWRNIDLRLEANYVQKGARLAFSRSSVEWQMDYIEFPLLLVINLSEKSKTAVELCVGMTYAIPTQRQLEVGDNLGYELDQFIDDDIFVNNTTVVHVNDVENSDIGFALGLGLSVPVGKVNFLVDARYTTGLGDAVDADYVQTITDGTEVTTTVVSTDFSNRCFSFMMGFAFPFGTRAPAESE